MNPFDKDVLTTGEVAKVCNVAARTVSKWFDSGQLQGYRIPGSKDRRIPVSSLQQFMRAVLGDRRIAGGGAHQKEAAGDSDQNRPRCNGGEHHQLHQFDRPAHPAQQIENDPQPEPNGADQREFVEHLTAAFRPIGGG